MTGFTSQGRVVRKLRPKRLIHPNRIPLCISSLGRRDEFSPSSPIILITAGNGIFESRQTGRRSVQAGDVILLFPGIWHRYRPDARMGWTEKWIQFNGAFVHKLWDRRILSEQRPVVSSTRFREIETAMEKLLNQIEQQPGFNSLRYVLQVSHVLDLILDSKLFETSPIPISILSAEDKLVPAAENYIWTHSQLDLSVRDIADYLGVSRRTLERRFGAALGRTVLEEVTRCRFSRAERLLRETDLPIKVIVYLAGFGRAENMRRQFMRRAELSPRAYRTKSKSGC